jgi:hypothetical protein
MAPSAYPSLSWCSMPMAALSVAILCFSVGCGSSLTSDSPLVAGSLRGNIHGGEQPIAGAQIQLFAAGTTGNGMGEIALLEQPVMSDANGNFSITGDYTCPSSSSQLYMVAKGGNPGLTPSTSSNPAIALMAALGPCSLHGGQYTLDPDSVISINEVTTVASVYALVAFIDGDGDDLGASGENLNGLANAFQKVKSLVDTSSGAALPGADQATINTLGDILAACVNSDGTGAACSMLFASSPPGRTEPPDTMLAIYEIVTNPTNQVSVLYGLVPASPPFQPTLAEAPNDWTLP